MKKVIIYKVIIIKTLILGYNYNKFKFFNLNLKKNYKFFFLYFK